MVNQTEIVKEKIKEDFSIFHKITSANEQHNFHIHDEFEIMLILSDGMMCAVVTLIFVPVMIVYVFLQKNIIKGLTAGAIKG